jgi:dihydroorotate dehydrogenase (NAD+) catalytic subunit
MKLLGIEFGRVWNSSGARSFFGEGYPFHRYLKPFGIAPDFRGSTFVAKTTTVEPRAGNLPLNGTRPTELFPKSIKVNFRRAAVLNAVGLSGPGLDALLADGRWQMRLEPFLLSFMAVDADIDQRFAKALAFAAKVAAERSRFRAQFGIECNFSCPNVGFNHGSTVYEVRQTLAIIVKELPGVPLIPKLNILIPVEIAAEIASHPACAAIACSNTIPWGKLPERIDWRGLFGETSPLVALGGGGLSGAPLTMLVRDWVRNATVLGFPVPIIAGGGVMCPDDAGMLFSHGAAAVELGSVAIVRSWRVRKIIKAVTPSKDFVPHGYFHVDSSR